MVLDPQVACVAFTSGQIRESVGGIGPSVMGLSWQEYTTVDKNGKALAEDMHPSMTFPGEAFTRRARCHLSLHLSTSLACDPSWCDGGGGRA
jgi:hypothetical protein